MLGIMVGKHYVGGYSPVYNIVTYTGKVQAKRFTTEEELNEFVEVHDIEDFEIVKL